MVNWLLKNVAQECMWLWGMRHSVMYHVMGQCFINMENSKKIKHANYLLNILTQYHIHVSFVASSFFSATSHSKCAKYYTIWCLDICISAFFLDFLCCHFCDFLSPDISCIQDVDIQLLRMMWKVVSGCCTGNWIIYSWTMSSTHYLPCNWLHIH